MSSAVKVSLAVTHKQGLMVGARSFPGNPYDGHVLSAQIEQTSNLQQVIVDLGYRGVDADNPGVQIIHRGKYKSLTDHEKRLLKRRQAIEPLIGHTKADHRIGVSCDSELPLKPDYQCARMHLATLAPWRRFELSQASAEFCAGVFPSRHVAINNDEPAAPTEAAGCGAI